MGTRLDSLKTASKKVLHEASEFLGNKSENAVTKSNVDKIVKPDENSRNNEKITIPLEQRDEMSNKLRKWNTIKYLNY